MEFALDGPRYRSGLFVWLLLISVAACSCPTSSLHTRGPAAASIADLWWLLTALAGVVFVAVIVFLLPTLRQRGDIGADQRRQRVFLWAAIGASAVILTIAFVASERTMAALHRAPNADDLTIKVKAWQWWWEITYDVPGSTDTVVSANEIHIPTGRRVWLELTTGDVIHSFWVPALQGKTDLVPGRTNRTWLQADQPGVSPGPCAEYCGVQHAHMTLLVVAHTPAEFAAWLARERLSAPPPQDSLRVAGAATFASAGCAYCHMVRGTASLGKLGPDLTHFASRRMLAAGTLENSPRHLATWLANPQRVKPGTRMPAVPLNGREFAAVVAYVGALR
ncbi:MAG: cytochrome c oxidase subunit II [Gemmatimonadaceae bacterium]